MAGTTKKFIALAAAGALVISAAGLTACGSSGSSSSAASSSNTSVSASSTASNAASNASRAASNTASSSAAAADTKIVAWRGALSDGALVTYIESDDGKHAAITIEPEKAEPKIWAGDVKADATGKVTITDDDSKEVINFVLTGLTPDAIATIDMSADGYGQGALVPLTAEEAAELASAELIAEALGTYTNSLGMLDNGSIIFYTENEDQTQGVVAIVSEDGSDMKVWSGALTTDANGKETVTDDKTKDTFSYTWTENKKDSTVTINSDKYGKGTLVKMSVGDWMALDEIEKELAKLAK